MGWLLPLVLLGCGPRYVSVTVTGVTEEMRALVLDVELDGQVLHDLDGNSPSHMLMRPPAAGCNGADDCFSLQLPDGGGGHLVLGLAGIGQTGGGPAMLPATDLALGWGKAEIDVGTGVRDLPMALNLYALRIRIKADLGKISGVMGDPCPAAAGDAPDLRCFKVAAGTTAAPQVALADPAASYFAGWQGAGCHGPASCSVKMSGPRALLAGVGARLCSADGLCWDNPLPQGNDLHGVWVAGGQDGFAAGEAFAVGNAGTVLHFDGAAWERWESGATADLYAVAGRASSVFVAGASGTLLQCSQKKCTARSSGTSVALRGLAGNATVLVAVGDPVAMGGPGVILSSPDGQAWSPVRNTSAGVLRAVWVDPQKAEGYAAGDVVLYLTDLTGTRAVSAQGNYGALSAIWGDGLGQVFAAGVDANAQGVVLQRMANGPWMSSNPLGQQVAFSALWGSSASDLWAAGQGAGTPPAGLLARWDGRAWAPVPLSGAAALSGVSGGAGQVWAVGAAGALQHYDGETWAAFSMGPTGALKAVTSDAMGGAWAAGAGAGNTAIVLRRVSDAGGDRWVPVQAPAGTPGLNAISGGGQVFAAGPGRTVLACAADGCKAMNTPGTQSDDWYAIAGAGGELWTAGANGIQGSLASLVNGTWTFASTPAVGALRALGAGQAGEWVAVGDRGSAHRAAAGASWSATNGLAWDLRGVAWDGTQFWAVGAQTGTSDGVIVQGSGDAAAWKLAAQAPALKGVVLGAVAARSGEVWAAGTGGTVLLQKQGAWQPLAGGTGRDLSGVTASPAEVLLAGDGGTILRHR